MARILYNLFTIVLLSLLSVRLSLSSDPPLTAPSPAPEHGGDSLSPPSPSPEFNSPPAPSPEFNSPPPPPPYDLSEFPADSPSTGSPSPSPSAESPSPAYKGEMSADAEEEKEKGEGSVGMKGGKKAGIVFGVVAAACVVGFGGVVYKKRQRNIKRAQYGYAARSDFL
ncbi:hypothetical protein RHMOL_Rhmol01G0295300 [Rhododendron molle]|uniref:Uncharacterized protein n=1 Tax=Rhododendron molle TaxID=49168 RepID=A0ACC0QA19_RHOML|nr:hypothetical protein RHMOL_Rhmol01G0295300 [Rhododendron molle]